MRLVTFTHKGNSRIGALVENTVIDLSVAAPELPTDMVAFLEAGIEALLLAKDAITLGAGRIPRPEVRLKPPILRPPKIICIGLNYAKHAAEAGIEPPRVPLVFNKQSLSVTGPYDPVYKPPESDQLDYEGELAFVIGKRCRRVPRDQAQQVIAGYTIMNDVSVRDWQLVPKITPHTMGKSWDTHGPMGPCIVTADELPDPHHLDIRTWVNGELRQDSNTNDLLFNCYWIVEHLSTAFTLEAGDVISTGTPSGVIAGMQNKVWLKPGDVVKIEIEKIGSIENTIVEEPSDTVLY